MAAWKKWALGVVAIAVLSGTHWFAYREGRKGQQEQLKGAVLDTQAAGHEDQLRASVAVLRVAVKHPADFNSNELFALRTRAGMQVTDVETVSVAHAKRTGNVDDERRLAALAATARELLTKLPAR